MDKKNLEWVAACLVKYCNKVILLLGVFTRVSVMLADQKPWARERPTAQATSGSVRHKRKSSTGNELRASTILLHKNKRALAVGRKIFWWSSFSAVNFFRFRKRVNLAANVREWGPSAIARQ